MKIIFDVICGESTYKIYHLKRWAGAPQRTAQVHSTLYIEMATSKRRTRTPDTSHISDSGTPFAQVQSFFTPSRRNILAAIFS